MTASIVFDLMAMAPLIGGGGSFALIGRTGLDERY